MLHMVEEKYLFLFFGIGEPFQLVNKERGCRIITHEWGKDEQSIVVWCASLL